MAFVMILLLIHWNLYVGINFSKEKSDKRKRRRKKKEEEDGKEEQEARDKYNLNKKHMRCYLSISAFAFDFKIFNHSVLRRSHRQNVPTHNLKRQ